MEHATELPAELAEALAAGRAILDQRTMAENDQMAERIAQASNAWDQVLAGAMRLLPSEAWPWIVLHRDPDRPAKLPPHQPFVTLNLPGLAPIKIALIHDDTDYLSYTNYGDRYYAPATWFRVENFDSDLYEVYPQYGELSTESLAEALAIAERNAADYHNALEQAKAKTKKPPETRPAPYGISEVIYNLQALGLDSIGNPEIDVRIAEMRSSLALAAIAMLLYHRMPTPLP